MKKPAKFLSTLLAVFALSSIVSAHADRIVTTEPLSQVIFSEISLAVEMHATLPRSASRDSILLKRLRTEIEETFREMREQANGDFREFGSETFNPYSLSSNWTEHYVSDRYLSLLQVSHYYSGGAHGNSGFTSLLWDLRESRELELEDILDNVEDGSPALKAILRHLRTALIAEKIDRNGFTEEEAREDLGFTELKASLEAMQTFTFVPSWGEGKIAGIKFVYGPYELGSYAEGDYQLFVPARVFEEFLKTEFDGMFGGEPIIMQALTSYPMSGATILLEEPRIDHGLSSPLELKGEAPDYWFQNGAATVEIYINDVKAGETEIQALPDARLAGMASGMVRFLGQITFETPPPDSYGQLRFLRGSGNSSGGTYIINHWISF